MVLIWVKRQEKQEDKDRQENIPYEELDFTTHFFSAGDILNKLTELLGKM